jgi:hypothetical protein
VATRQAAIEVLERGHAAVRRLLKEIPDHWTARPGVGGGDWSPKDLVAHLTFWEERVLEARAPRAPREAVRARSRHTLAKVLRDWDNVHGELIRTIRTMPDARWENPATPRGRKSLEHRIGQLLVGREPFGHAEAHVKDLEAFVDRIPEGDRAGAG